MRSPCQTPFQGPKSPWQMISPGAPMTSRIQRTGDTVHRPANFWTPAVHGLLGHLQTAGFLAPRSLDTEGEREVLTWIDGESGPDGWAKIVPESGLRNWAAFLRRYHDAVAD
jgi:hypothetical protein